MTTHRTNPQAEASAPQASIKLFPGRCNDNLAKC